MSGCPFPEHHGKGQSGGLLALLLIIGAAAGVGASLAHHLAGAFNHVLAAAAAAVVLGLVAVTGLGVWRYREVHGPPQRQAAPVPVPEPVPVQVRVRPPAWPQRPPGETVNQAREA